MLGRVNLISNSAITSDAFRALRIKKVRASIETSNESSYVRDEFETEKTQNEDIRNIKRDMENKSAAYVQKNLNMSDSTPYTNKAMKAYSFVDTALNKEEIIKEQKKTEVSKNLNSHTELQYEAVKGFKHELKLPLNNLKSIELNEQVISDEFRKEIKEAFEDKKIEEKKIKKMLDDEFEKSIEKAVSSSKYKNYVRRVLRERFSDSVMTAATRIANAVKENMESETLNVSEMIDITMDAAEKIEMKVSEAARDVEKEEEMAVINSEIAYAEEMITDIAQSVMDKMDHLEKYARSLEETQNASKEFRRQQIDKVLEDKRNPKNITGAEVKKELQAVYSQIGKKVREADVQKYLNKVKSADISSLPKASVERAIKDTEVKESEIKKENKVIEYRKRIKSFEGLNMRMRGYRMMRTFAQ